MEESLSQNIEGFSTELEEMFQENSHRPEPTDDIILRSESIGESVSIKTEEVM